MKASELMIGDWVLYNNQPHQIRQLGIFGENRDGDDYPAVCVGKPNGVGLILERNEIEPIPLTPEILEKNGFTQCEPQGYDLYIKDKEGAGLYRIFWQGESYNYYLEIAAYAYPLGEFNKTNIKYVHQLQHALRLCGIDKQILTDY